MEDILEYLEILHLNEKEKQVLVALYEYGPMTASRIAGRTKIERTLTYKVLKELKRITYVQEIKTDKGLLYKAREIENVIFEYERKLQALKKAEKMLEEMKTKKADSPDILVLEGKEGIREALYYGAENEENIEILAVYSDTYQADFIEMFNERYQFHKKHNIHIKVIFPSASKAMTDYAERVRSAGYQVECRYNTKIQEETTTFFDSSVEILNNTFKIYSYKERRAIIITDQQLAEAQKFLFWSLWKNGAQT